MRNVNFNNPNIPDLLILDKIHKIVVREFKISKQNEEHGSDKQRANSTQHNHINLLDKPNRPSGQRAHIHNLLSSRLRQESIPDLLQESGNLRLIRRVQFGVRRGVNAKAEGPLQSGQRRLQVRLLHIGGQVVQFGLDPRGLLGRSAHPRDHVDPLRLRQTPQVPARRHRRHVPLSHSLRSQRHDSSRGETH